MIPRLKNYPTEGPRTILNGAIDEYILGQNACNFLRVASASATFVIRIDDTYEIRMSAGKKFDTAPEKFRKIEVINNSGGNLTYLLEIGTGSISSDEVVLSGTSNVSDTTAHGKLDLIKTSTDLVKTSVDSVKTSVDALATQQINDDAKRTALSTFTGASYASLSTATSSTVVASGTNVNGIVIRHGSISCGNTALSGIRTGAANYIMGLRWAGQSGTFKDIFIPAGQSLEIVCGGTDSRVDVWYEVL